MRGKSNCLLSPRTFKPISYRGMLFIFSNKEFIPPPPPKVPNKGFSAQSRRCSAVCVSHL